MFIRTLEYHPAFTENELGLFYLHSVNSKLQKSMHSVILIVANSVYEGIHIHAYPHVVIERLWKPNMGYVCRHDDGQRKESFIPFVIFDFFFKPWAYISYVIMKKHPSFPLPLLQRKSLMLISCGKTPTESQPFVPLNNFIGYLVSWDVKALTKPLSSMYMWIYSAQCCVFDFVLSSWLMQSWQDNCFTFFPLDC